MLCSHADADRGNCWPGKALLCREAGVKDIKQVQKALQELEKAGAVERELRSGTVTRYWLKPPPFNEDVGMVERVKTPPGNFNTGVTRPSPEVSNPPSKESTLSEH